MKCLKGEKEIKMDFWSELIKTVVSNGVFAMLFVFLFFYQLRDSSQREDQYQETIKELTKHLEVIEEVKEEVCELKQIVEERTNEKN